MRRATSACVVPLALALAAASASAATQSFTLGFATLPSAQGFAFTPSGSHTGAIESNIFSLSGGALVQNSMGQGYGVSGGGILYVGLSGLINASEPKQLRMTARCLQVEGSGGGALGQQGFAAGFTTGSVQYDISLTPTQIYALGPSGAVLVAGTYDNTNFHEYLLEFTPPGTQRIYRDGTLLFTSTSGFSVAASRVFIGDGTGGANARAEITALQFLQNYATAARPSSWGRVKHLYH